MTYPLELRCLIGREIDDRRENVEITIAPPGSLVIGTPRPATNPLVGDRELVVQVGDAGAADLPEVRVELPDGPCPLPVPTGADLPPGIYRVSLRIDAPRTLRTVLRLVSKPSQGLVELSYGPLPDADAPAPDQVDPAAVELPAEQVPETMDPLLAEWGITDPAHGLKVLRVIDDIWREYVAKPSSQYGREAGVVDGRSWTRMDYFFLRPGAFPAHLQDRDNHGRTEDQERWADQGTAIWQMFRTRLKTHVSDFGTTKKKGAQHRFRIFYDHLRELEAGRPVEPLTWRPFELPGNVQA